MVATGPAQDADGRPDGAVAAAPAAGDARRIERRRPLPGARAVVGALLVAVAVIGVVAAHLQATAAPDARYLVAATDTPTGTLLGDATAVERRFEAVALELPSELAGRAVGIDAAAALVGRRTAAPIRAGDLLLESTLAPDAGGDGSSTFAFALPPSSAVGGQLTVGERIDVVATVGTGSDATTAYVVRAAPLLDVQVGGGSGGLGGEVVQLTVALAEKRDVQALAHALATATVVVVRAPDDGSDVPDPYRFGERAPERPS